LDGAKDGLGQFEASEISHVLLFFLVIKNFYPSPLSRDGGYACTMQALSTRRNFTQWNTQGDGGGQSNETPKNICENVAVLNFLSRRARRLQGRRAINN
jgi:hypothetical protein